MWHSQETKEAARALTPAVRRWPTKFWTPQRAKYLATARLSKFPFTGDVSKVSWIQVCDSLNAAARIRRAEIREREARLVLRQSHA